MSEQQTQAASSPAVAVDVFEGHNPTVAEYNKYRETGELPERLKPAETVVETASADAPEETVESEDDESKTASESETEEEAQEPPQKGKGAQKRILQLLAEKKELERKLEAAAKPGAKTDPPPAQNAEQGPQTRPKPTVDATQDGKPKYATYEEYVEDLADWKAEQRVAAAQREYAQQQALNALKSKLDESRSRYEDADAVIFPTAKLIQDSHIPLAVKEVFAGSDHFVDLCYVVGSDTKELESFISLAQSNPRAALAKVFEYEKGIREEQSKAGKEAVVEPSGKAPEKKQTTAPKPPSPVGGGSSRAFDVSDESLSNEEWFRKRNAQEARKKG